MGSLSLVCPMCCGETFNNPQSLKYHLLSMTDNLYCPSCSQRSDSVTALIQHLDRCGQASSGIEEHFQQIQAAANCQQDPEAENDTDSEILMDTNVEQIDQTFLATVNSNGIMIVGAPQTIQVDENGEIKIVNNAENGETQANNDHQVELKAAEDLSGMIDRETTAEERALSSCSTVTSVSAATPDGKTDGKNVIGILPDESSLLEGNGGALIDMDYINNGQDLDESRLLQVKRELCELGSEVLYSCSSCDMSFNSVLEHIKRFHDGQEVVLEVVEHQMDDLMPSVAASMSEESDVTVMTAMSTAAAATAAATSVATIAATTTTGTVAAAAAAAAAATTAATAAATATAVANVRQRQTMNTLRSEECVDNEGRLYTRKVVQIERFWDRNSATVQSTKAPMIEKFFSNVQGVKVREKKLTVAPLRMYRCNQCLQQFSKLGNYRVHACLNGNNRCDSCDQTFATARALQLHAKVHDGDADHAPRTFLCTICGTEFCSHKSLRLHSRMHAPVRARHVDAPEGTPSGTFTCPECGKVLSESYKEAHMALHSGDSVTCTVCNRKFDSADSLAMHAAVHTELSQSHSPTPSFADTKSEVCSDGQLTASTQQKPYQCQHCGRRFTRPHEKVKHERIHTGEKPHACEVCGKTFRVSYCLTLHMRTHTGVRPYGCQHCGKRFKASSVYNHHLLTHGEERAYTCPYCPKTFKTRVQLAGHKNSHTKPFRCTECSRPFASLYAARAHIQTHKKDNNLKFSCYVCGASYGRAFALKDHLKQHGQDVLTPPEPAREEEVHEGDDFLLAEEGVDGVDGVEEVKLVIPSPLPVGHSSEIEESD